MLIQAERLRELSSATICGMLGALFIAWYIISSVAAWHRLRHIPGPKIGSFSYLWEIYTLLSGNVYERFLNLRDYGPIVRIAPNYLVTSDPDVLRRTMSARTTYRRDAWYRGSKIHPDVDSIASQIITRDHDVLKAKTASSYAGRETSGGLEQAVDTQLIRLVNLIRRKYISSPGETKNVDFGRLSRYFTMDIISQLLFGEAWGHMDEGEDVLGWASTMDTFLPALTWTTEMPLLRKILVSKWGLLGFIGPKETDKQGLGVVMKHVNGIVRQRFHDEERHMKPKKDMMGGFIRNGMTQSECEGEAILAILAGNDTTAGSIRTVMLHLMASPRAYSKFKQEIRQAVEQGKVSSPITSAESQRLPYTQAVMWEGLRIGSAVTWGHYKVVPPEGDTIHGMFIPGGTCIGHNTIALTHNKKIFGEDADIFRPERFLECDANKKTEMLRAIEMTFGGGTWACSGKNVAMMEMHKTVFELLRAFDFQIVNIRKPFKERIYITRVHDDMFVRITETDWNEA